MIQTYCSSFDFGLLIIWDDRYLWCFQAQESYYLTPLKVQSPPLQSDAHFQSILSLKALYEAQADKDAGGVAVVGLAFRPWVLASPMLL